MKDSPLGIDSPLSTLRTLKSTICALCVLLGESFLWLGIFLLIGLSACKENSRAIPPAEPVVTTNQTAQPTPQEQPLAQVLVDHEVEIRHFFAFLDKLVAQYDSLSTYPLTENLILRANPWILDSLVQTDYYLQMAKGNFVYDQPRMRILHPGDTIRIPGPKLAAKLLDKMARTWLDLNIPAFELRIMEGDSVLYNIPVRVGKNESKRLELAGHEVDLRTRTGEGSIMRVNRYPIFIDPVTGERFKYTKRDDRQTTLMPQIPWIEPIIDGKRYGQLIHPTTNPRTLGKAASNGCIGTSEADAWRIYQFAPVGAKLVIRYDLQAVTPAGDTLRYPDIYAPVKKRKAKKDVVSTIPTDPAMAAQICQCDPLF
ncbi:MAG: L,D-transpeptidase [Saprospiraceae bacterium]|nr:L,D-transpeptidase [Saprospiraceae bacterium]